MIAVEQRFWSKVQRRTDDECWLWTASVTTNGAGRFQFEGKARLAHRMAYALSRGNPLDSHACIRHTCDALNCVNPRHLYPAQDRRDPVDWRFWRQVRKTPTCWLWTGVTDSGGYGRFKIGSASKAVHRLSYAWHCGEIPEGLDVLHSCDTCNCVNPEHLRVGTHTENMHDMVRKDRNLFGEAKPNARLTAANVLEIRSSAATDSELARRFQVAIPTITNARLRRTWRRVS